MQRPIHIRVLLCDDLYIWANLCETIFVLKHPVTKGLWVCIYIYTSILLYNHKLEIHSLAVHLFFLFLFFSCIYYKLTHLYLLQYCYFLLLYIRLFSRISDYTSTYMKDEHTSVSMYIYITHLTYKNITCVIFYNLNIYIYICFVHKYENTYVLVF